MCKLLMEKSDYSLVHTEIRLKRAITVKGYKHMHRSSSFNIKLWMTYLLCRQVSVHLCLFIFQDNKFNIQRCRELLYKFKQLRFPIHLNYIIMVYNVLIIFWSGTYISMTWHTYLSNFTSLFILLTVPLLQLLRLNESNPTFSKYRSETINLLN